METFDRSEYEGKVTALKAGRNTWDGTFKEVGTYLAPRRARFELDQTNRGDRRDQKIINSFAGKAVSVAQAGLHAGITSPARPWFRFSTGDIRQMDDARVKEWLYSTEGRMRLIIARSNAYKGLSAMYGDLVIFGTAVLWVDEDKDDVIRTYNIPMGSYWLAADERGMVNTILREQRMTVAQVVRKFGRANCSDAVKQAWDGKRYQEAVDVYHLVEPRYTRDITKSDSANKPFRSVWWEKSGTRFLQVSGYEEFPALVARWDVCGNDVYGWGPGPEALGDIKALQTLERRKGQLVDKLTNPPMKAPTSMLNKRASLLPGDVTYVDANANGASFEPVQKISGVDIAAVGEEISRHEQRIGDIFMTNLWLMMSQSDRREITAREVDERHEEKMLQIGPTLERLHDEVLDPFIDRVFAIMLRTGLLPPPPPTLAGQELKVEYISIMAQAQKMLNTTSVDRLASFVGNLSNIRPEVQDKIDFDEMIDAYADMLGVKPTIIRAAKAVSAMRAARAKVQQQQQQLAMEAEAAKTTQALSRSSTGENNLLRKLLSDEGGGSPAVAQANFMAEA